MNLPNVLVFNLALTTCVFAEIVAQANPSNQDLAISKYKTNYPETYMKMQHDVKKGTAQALDTCRDIFKDERWNCDVNKKKLLVHNGKSIPTFVRSSLPANKEGAYLQALGSASVMYTLTMNCGKGKYENCACVPIDRPFKPGQKWKWSGCNENLNFGEDITKHFIDSVERRAINRKRAALNLHNNEVGRKVVRRAARKKCKCHGPTASCAIKTCWRELVNFAEVGKLLKTKYDSAVRVEYVNNTIKLFNSTVSPEKGRKGTLAYFNRSPKYCQPQTKTGFPGIKGRKCIHGSDGARQCNRMCTACGLKYRNDEEVKHEKCQCKFEWCCKVECQICKKKQKITVCL